MKKIFIILVFGFISLFGFEHLNPKNIDDKINNKNVIIDFYATWCPPCKVLDKNLNSFDKIKSPNVVIYKVDIDQHMDLAKRYNVSSLPTIVYVKNGKVLKKEVGVSTVDDLMMSSNRYF